MINRISQLAPEKDLKRYYIRDALGNLARFTNDKISNMLEVEYHFDLGSKELVRDYRLEEDDGWTFLNIYLGKIYGFKKDIISEETKNIIEKIIASAPVCLSTNNSSEKQERINVLQTAIKKYTKQNKISTFCDDVESLLYDYDHSSFIAYSMIVIIICMILNEYDPYDICYINEKNKAVYYYCELSRGIYTCCDFREVSLEQSVNLANDMEYIKATLGPDRIREFGSPESFNVAYSKKMLNDIESLYGSKCFKLKDYIIDYNKKNVSRTIEKIQYMGEDINDMIISSSAKYFDNTIKLLQFSAIDNHNTKLIEDIENNRMKLFLDFNDDEHVNNTFFEMFYRYYGARLLQNNLIDITKRKRLFTNGIDIEFNPTNVLFKGIEFKYHIQEYIYKDKLRIYIRIQNQYMNRYFILSEGHKDWPLLCYNGFEFIAILFALVIIGVDNISGIIIDMCKTFFLDVVSNQRKNNCSILTVNDDGVKTDDSDSLVTNGCLFMSKVIMETITEIETMFDSQVSGSGNEYQGRKILSISEMYSEEVHLNPFIRKLPTGQSASDNAKNLAKRLRVELPDGYTIVEGHNREVKKKKK